jgi:hypothetical protein
MRATPGYLGSIESAEKIRGAPTMSAVVWANILLTIPFLIAFIGIPMWLTFRRPETSPDHAGAHAYLRSRSAPAPHQPARNPAERVTTAA